MKKQFINPTVRVVNFNSGILCVSNVDRGEDIKPGEEVEFEAPTRRNIFE